jgi:2-methylcitrate dehydratase PrpD
LLAARIAATGARAAPHSLEGVAGFYNATSGHLDYLDSVLVDLGCYWQILDVTQKLFPICALLQGAVANMIKLACETDLAAGDVEEVTVYLSPFEAKYPGIDRRGPFSSQGGTLMSAQYCVSLALLTRSVTLEGLLRFDDSGVGDLMERVHVRSDNALGLLSSRLELQLRDGRTLVAEAESSSASNKLSFDETVQLLRKMTPEMRVSSDRLERLIETVNELERQPDVARLLSCLQGCAVDTVTRSEDLGPRSAA